MFDGLYPPGLQWYWKADFAKELSDDAIAAHVRHGSKLPAMLSTMHLYPINGKAHQVAKSETAWSYRDAVWAQVLVGVGDDPANNEQTIAWAAKLLGCDAPILGRWRLCELHDARGGREPRQSKLSREL